jgi:hypothetical protein
VRTTNPAPSPPCTPPPKPPQTPPRGCNEPTAHASIIGARDVPLCPRCQAKYNGMVSGEYPQNVGSVDASVEPLSYWLPRVLGSMPRMAPAARREFCDRLVLRQDDAWLALIRSS